LQRIPDRSSTIDNPEFAAYNRLMGSLGQPTPALEEPDSSRMIILLAVAGVIVAILGIAFLLREPAKPAQKASPYISNLKFSNFKMSAAENFIGATVSYMDGTVTNIGDKTVTGLMLEVTFKDDIGQLAQREDVPLRVLRDTGPYQEPVGLSVSPLGPGQSKPFRLTFDSISAQWNRQPPELRVTDVQVK
jgi:hypothetical protein